MFSIVSPNFAFSLDLAAVPWAAWLAAAACVVSWLLSRRTRSVP